MELIDHSKASALDMVTERCEGDHRQCVDLLCVLCGWEGHAEAHEAPWTVFVRHLREQRLLWTANVSPDMAVRVQAYLDVTNPGGFRRYVTSLQAGQRSGQAFFNALNKEDQQRLCGTINDPFYNDKVLGWAIDFLLAK